MSPLALGAAFPPVFPLGSLYAGDGSRGFVLTGIDTLDYSGKSVSAAGDINGDGIDDLIIGAPLATNPTNEDFAGESYVVFGSAAGFPPVVPLSSLYPDGGGDGSRGFVLTGVNSNDESGTSVSAAGDVNGDGIDDLVIGAPFAERDGESDAGESYVVFGSTQGFPAIFHLEDLYPLHGGDGGRGVVFSGANTRFLKPSVGFSVSAAGDVNGDGMDDLIIGAPQHGEVYQGATGVSYVVFGRRNFPPMVPLANVLEGDGTAAFALIEPEHLYSALRARGAGDVNGDGIDDLILGDHDASPGYNNDGEGQSFVVFGSTQGFPASFPLARLFPPGGGDGSRGFVLPGIDKFDDSGRFVSAAGDVNGDGIDDVIVGAYRGDPGGDFDAGESYVVFGSTQRFPAIFPFANLYPAGGGDGSRGFVLTGVHEREFSGYSVSAAGDVNGDGIDDLIIGATDRYGNAAGESYVVFGSTQGFTAVFPLAQLLPAGGGDGSRGVVLTGIDAGDLSGSSVSAAGDVNGDGVDDLIIGAWRGDPGGVSNAGETYVVFGRAAGP